MCDKGPGGDSGIDSVQASPSPIAGPYPSISGISTVQQQPSVSPTLSNGGNCNKRRPSSALLHPDHARIFIMRPQPSPDQVILFQLFKFNETIFNTFFIHYTTQTSIEDTTEFNGNYNGSIHLCTASSSTTSSLTSIAAVSVGNQQRYNEYFLIFFNVMCIKNQLYNTSKLLFFQKYSFI